MFPNTPRAVAQKVTVGATHAESSAFAAATKRIRLVATVDTYIALGSAPTATSSSLYLVANVPEFFGVIAGEKVSALRVGGSDGVLSIAEGV
jgi:hypothetical protein